MHRFDPERASEKAADSEPSDASERPIDLSDEDLILVSGAARNGWGDGTPQG